MKKTITANINGIVFHIESEAYDQLNRYINTIRSYFENTDEVDEIISDIEARISELFKEMLNEDREVVTMLDVNKVIEIMGEPEQFIDSDEEYSSQKRTYSSGSFRKKLYRDPDDKVLGGVCSGIGHYFGIDSIWIRAIFLIAFFAFGVGLLPYVILWIIMPIAKTASEKLEMKGEAVTVDSIGRTIRDEYNNFKKKVDTERFSTAGNKIEQFFSFLFGLIVYVFKFLVKAIAFVVILATLAILLFFSAGILTGPDSFNIEINNVDYLMQTELIGLVLDSQLLHYTVCFSLILVFAIPLMALLYAALKLFFNFKGGNKFVGLALGSLWVLGFLTLIVSAFVVADKFSSKYTDSQVIELSEFKEDTLYLESYVPKNLEPYGFDEDENLPIFLEDERVYLEAFSIDVYPSNTEKFKIRLKKKSFGDNNREAENKAKNIAFSYELSDTVLSVNQYLDFPESDGFRNQEIEASIGVPLNKVIYFGPTSKNIIHDVENVTDTWDYDMLGHYWKMTGRGLECLDCEWSFPDTTTSATDTIIGEVGK